MLNDSILTLKFVFKRNQSPPCSLKIYTPRAKRFSAGGGLESLSRASLLFYRRRGRQCNRPSNGARGSAPEKEK